MKPIGCFHCDDGVTKVPLLEIVQRRLWLLPEVTWHGQLVCVCLCYKYMACEGTTDSADSLRNLPVSLGARLALHVRRPKCHSVEKQYGLILYKQAFVFFY
jgi:hypothetical protein